MSIAALRLQPQLSDINAASPKTGASMVSVRGLSKTYHRRKGNVIALRDVSLEVAAGEFLVLLGPSGCGKTTLLRCIAGLEQPSGGEITVNGKLVYCAETGLSLPPEQRNLSMVFQSYALWPHMTVFDNVAYPLKISRVARAEIQNRVAGALRLAGLEKLGQHHPGQLSGGQQQRVALARALVSNDGLVLFDEPLSNLDAKVRERLRDELVSMQREFGFTGIYVTHDQTEAAALAHRIAVMQVGCLSQCDDPMTLFNEPASAYVADFVGWANEVEAKVTGHTGSFIEASTALGPMLGVAAAPGLAPGNAARVMFRPDHGAIDTSTSNGANRVMVLVEQSIYLGTQVEYRVRQGEVRLSVRSMSGPLLAPGTEISVLIDPRHVRVFAA